LSEHYNLDNPGYCLDAVADSMRDDFFSWQENVESWLKHTPRELALVFAARAALRAAPMLLEAVDRLGGMKKAGPTIILPAFRAMAAAWTAARYPTQRSDLRLSAAATAAEAAAKAADAYALSGVANVARAAAYAARTAVDAERASVAYSARVLAGDAVWNAIYAIRVEDFADERYARVLKFSAALAADATEIDVGRQKKEHANVIAARVAGEHLWLRGVPSWASRVWDDLEQILHADDTSWQMWTSWYRARIDGSSSNEGLEIARVLTPRDIWESGPDAVNAYLSHLTEEYGRPLEASTPSIPTQRSAAMEPVWIEDHLTLPKTPPDLDLSPTDLVASLSALRQNLSEFVDDIQNEANIDKRFTSLVRRLCQQIPENLPLQHDLFRLGHAEEMFSHFRKSVEIEWPDILAARYHALAFQFDLTMRQFPVWRDFKRNAARQSFTPEQTAAASSLADAAIDSFRDEDAKIFIDPIISEVLVGLAEPLRLAESTRDFGNSSETGLDDLAYDVVESINNVLKRVAERALATARATGATMGKASRQYARQFETGLIEESARLGKKHGQYTIKWLGRTVFVGGTSYALAHLIKTYPAFFDWIPSFIEFLTSHWPL
jgi:hypothetical protein